MTWAGSDGYAVVKQPSGEQRRVLAKCTATIGTLSNPQHKNIKLGKAGANRHAGTALMLLRTVCSGQSAATAAARRLICSVQRCLQCTHGAHPNAGHSVHDLCTTSTCLALSCHEGFCVVFQPRCKHTSDTRLLALPERPPASNVVKCKLCRRTLHVTGYYLPMHMPTRSLLTCPCADCAGGGASAPSPGAWP